MATTSPNERSVKSVELVAEIAERIAGTVDQVIMGKPDVVRLVVTALLAEGHVLIEDVPGVGKTSIARALAASIDASWHRIQFTPDLLPSDVTGAAVYHQHDAMFRFHAGPIFANIVVGDEINRASPKTQSALLEVMEERVVTVDGVAHPVPRPFIVLATQNPIEMDGTYRLPEAQVDRFLMRIAVGYPDLAAESAMMAEDGAAPGIELLRPVVSGSDIRQLIATVASVEVASPLREYIATLASATRRRPEVRLGASPRASLALMRAARARAAMAGRPFATADDVKALLRVVLGHRVLLAPSASLSTTGVEQVLAGVMAATPVPTSLPR
jgi:MoxR-like ATPase